ncbi:hypothetical protein BC941DRAFT_429925 [Chlamydoabsidia padenii]|nr:hypothetical protein BC941DRAFT_429925 [Chlamydoabsidia padenii]
MIFDGREETLREVCAMGNTKAVQQYIIAGVKINSQNKMNGWTGLHWASHRGQEDIVRLLLSNGADATIKTNKGQTALDLCSKYPSIQAMLEAQQVERTDVGPEPTIPIVPAYMKEPDLEKSWLLPDEFAENKVERVIRQETAKDMLAKEDLGITRNVTLPVKQPQQPSVSNQNTEKEMLVYLGTKSDETILGSVYLKNEEMTLIVTQLEEELDDLPPTFTLARHNGKVCIPINSKQMKKFLLDIFRGGDDDNVLVVVPSSSSS